MAVSGSVPALLLVGCSAPCCWRTYRASGEGDGQTVLLWSLFPPPHQDRASPGGLLESPRPAGDKPELKTLAHYFSALIFLPVRGPGAALRACCTFMRVLPARLPCVPCRLVRGRAAGLAPSLARGLVTCSLSVGCVLPCSLGNSPHRGLCNQALIVSLVPKPGCKVTCIWHLKYRWAV